MIKSIRLRWAGHIAQGEEDRCVEHFGGEEYHIEGPGVDERIIIK
jgi:hypothetical protein